MSTTDYAISDYSIEQQRQVEALLKYSVIYSVAKPSEDVLLFLKNSNCTISVIDEPIIKDFIDRNPSVIGYLSDAPSVIFKHFKNAKLSLELFIDPEIENDNGKLFLNILTNLDPKEALDGLGKIDKEWLLSAVGNDISKFNINIEII